MSFRILILLLAAQTTLLATGPGGVVTDRQATIEVAQLQVFFSPNGGCTAAVVGELNKARKSVLVKAYSFTSIPIAKALVDAKRRGVDVRMILDRGRLHERYSEADFTAHAGIPTWIDGGHFIAHNKVMIIDEETVITGSFNFTADAERRNAENLLVIHDAPEIVKKYTDNWLVRQRVSEPYAGR